MHEQPEDPAEEVRHLQRCINELVSLLALPAVWAGREPSQIIDTLLDAVVRALSLQFAYVRLNEGFGPAIVEQLRMSDGTEFDVAPEELRGILATLFAAQAKGSAVRRFDHSALGSISVFSLPLSVQGELGVFVAGADRADFPSKTEGLLLGVAANQASLGLQEARLLGEQKQINDELDRRVAERTSELTAANGELRDARAALQNAFDEIRRSEAKLSQVLDAIPTIAWCNLPDGPNEFLNRSWHEYTGLSPEQSHGWGWQVAFHSDDLPPLMKAWQQMLVSGEPGEIEARIRRNDGVYRWFLIRAEPFLEQGKLVRWYGTSTDIDDRKRAEQELRDTQAEFGTVMRVMTMGQLTASIAHEVNQPLSGILTNASTCLRMLSNHPPDVEGARETARRAIRDGNRAADVIKRLRTLYSNKEPALESMDLNEATREVIALSQSELQRSGVILRQELTDDLRPVVADRIQLQQVILNFLRNAADAMSTVDDRPRELLVTTDSADENQVRLSVKDSGVGLTPESSGKIFHAFHTTKTDGMGIGLSISRSIIEAHQGRIWAVSNDGPGCTFSFAIPRDLRSSAEGKAATA